MKKTLHIVEPTLASQAGHCFNHAHSLTQANHAFDIHLWIDRGGHGLFEENLCRVRAYFHRRWRKFQLAICYSKCLREGDGIFVPTAGQLDMWWLDILQRFGVGGIRPTAVILHFHQFRKTSAKQRRLLDWARRHPEWHILATTERLLGTFRQAGFKQCHVAYYPAVKPADHPKARTDSIRLVYAGAVRRDKGFVKIVEYLEYLVGKKLDWPATIQCSPPSVKLAAETETECADALKRIRCMDYPNLKIVDRTLSMTEYHSLFNNAICLLLYDREAYHDKFSSVALEALFSGAPIITVSGTWMGDVVAQHDAGVVIEELSLEAIHSAVQRVKAQFPMYRDRALLAGRILAQVHEPKGTLELIQKAMEVPSMP